MLDGRLTVVSVCQVEDPSFVEHFSGNRLLPGSETAAHCYAGHQFGHFSGQLGDGAAIYLGEVTSLQMSVCQPDIKVDQVCGTRHLYSNT